MDIDTGGFIFKRGGNHTRMEVACGQCLGCRLDRSRMWAMRIVHESCLYDDNCFVTLTYDDSYLPGDYSLKPEDFVLFMKRLRKHFEPEKVRFYMCGEYGSTCLHGLNLDLVKCPSGCNVGRPHYHACLFNCSFSDLESVGSRDNRLLFSSALLADIWKYGFVNVGELNFDSAAYVARYIMKKITGDSSDEHYSNVDSDGVVVPLVHEYSSMSLKPGIGRDWFLKYKDDFFSSDEVPVPGTGMVRPVPRYYGDIFAGLDPAAMEEVKRLRKEFHKKHRDDFTPERLAVKYAVKKAKVSLLKRIL